MQGPPTPSDETRTLRALAAQSILDTLPEERFDRITRLVCWAFEVPIALLTLVDRDRQWFKSCQGFEAWETNRQVSSNGHDILEASPLVVPDTLLDPRFADDPLVVGEPHIRFYAGQPIHGPNESKIGTLCIIDRQPRTLSEEDLARLADFAAVLDREFSLLEHATTDELTRLANRRGFAMVATHILALCRRSRQPATLITIDLDHFKSVNDTQGHHAGDEVLRQFGRLLHRRFRASDVVARLGGDEFAVLCSGTTADQLKDLIERLRREFADSTLARAHPNLSWSTGLAEFDPKSADTIQDLLQMADVRMYGAKADNKRHTVAG
jgi:diguanylate cyclase (GGDEF)-like protein